MAEHGTRANLEAGLEKSRPPLFLKGAGSGDVPGCCARGAPREEGKKGGGGQLSGPWLPRSLGSYREGKRRENRQEPFAWPAGLFSFFFTSSGPGEVTVTPTIVLFCLFITLIYRGLLLLVLSLSVLFFLHHHHH